MTTTKTLAAEPGNNTFVVWYDPYNEPYAVYFRSDANSWGDQRWFNADQHHGSLTDPSDWDDLCDELDAHNGPHLLVPDAKAAELTAELVKVRAQLTDANRALDGYKADERSLTAANTALADENLRLREQVYAHKPVIDAALTWAEMCEDGGLAPDDCRKSEDELHDAVESYRLMDMALTSAREEQAEVAS